MMNQPFKKPANAAALRPEPHGDAYRARRRQRLSQAEQAVLELVSNLSQRLGYCHSGKAFMAHELKVSQRYFRTLINRLQQRGCLAITERPGKSNLLRVLKFVPDDGEAGEKPFMSIAYAPGDPEKACGQPGASEDVRGEQLIPPGGINCSPPRGGSTDPPTKKNTLTLRSLSAAEGLFGDRWIGGFELAVREVSQTPATLAALFDSGGIRFAQYTGNNPLWASCRTVRTLAGAVAGTHVVFLKFLIEDSGRVEEITVQTKMLGAWRFR